jgi:uncharacterized protein YjiS (DUF1127 family)
MIKAISLWRQKRRYRALYRQLSDLDTSVLADVGVKQDDLETLRRGHSPWGEGNMFP